MIKYKKNLLIGLILFNHIFCVGQSAPYEFVSIYEIGESTTNCDVNIKNLLKNWTPERIVNANEYEFLEWSFVETISDSSQYVYYRNYFSSDKPVYSSVMRKTGSSYPPGNEYDSLWIYPAFSHSEYYDTRSLPDEAREILSEDVRLKAIDINSKDFNIDTIPLLYHSYHKKDSTMSGDIHNYSVRTESYDIATIDSLSQNYIDVNFTREKSFGDLSIEEAKKLLLEGLLIERIAKQLHFKEQVRVGDKVFMIKFKHKDRMHNEKIYNNYIICDSETNKVVMDSFFLRINLKK